MSDLTAIVTAHSDAVWRTAYRLLNNHEDALDCYQETFLAALRLSRTDEVRHWRTMLLRIATRKAIDRLRQRYHREQASDSLEQLALARPPVEAPDARALDEELHEQVRWALGALPPQQAEAFWLRHLEQLSPSDVAELMGIEPGHVRVLVHRAAAGLRTFLGPSFGPAPISEESP
ncbi:MAG TPA: sigma-70 family RNA polymerase sigma factor [Pirellulales bacterium]|jgi:RNA polymerase sigma-70 factor (ECF subfamily)|nr:sigma-70 family RNA polymerase sigma factor [Pirellulales bacterium]